MKSRLRVVVISLIACLTVLLAFNSWHGGWWFALSGNTPPSAGVIRTGPNAFRLTKVMDPILEGEKDSVRFSYSILNDSQSPIRELRVISQSCSCLSVQLAATEIAPGKTAELTMDASLRVAGGTKRLLCTVEGKGHDGTNFRWECEGQIQVYSRAHTDESEMAFDDCTHSNGYEKSLWLTLRRRANEEMWHVQELIGSNLNVGLSVSQKQDEQETEIAGGIFEKRIKLSFSLQAPRFSGRHSACICLTQASNKLEIAIPVRWSLADHFTLDPPQAFFIAGSDVAPVSGAFVLRRKDRADFSISQWTSAVPGIELLYKKTKPGEYQLQITATPSTGKAFQRWEVDVKTECLDQPEFRIPVSVIVGSQMEASK